MHVPIISGGYRLAVGEDEGDLAVLDGRALDLLSGLLGRLDCRSQCRPARLRREEILKTEIFPPAAQEAWRGHERGNGGDPPPAPSGP